MTKNSTYPTPTKTSSVLGTAMGAALFGAIVGGTGAAAKGIREIKAGDATKEEVAMGVAREAGSTAVAAGTATAVVGALRFGPVLSTLGIIAAATGTKYAMDTLLKPKQPEIAPALATAGAPAAPKKTATSKTATQKKTAKKKTTKKASTSKNAAPKKTAAQKTATTKNTAKKAPAQKTETKSKPETKTEKA